MKNNGPDAHASAANAHANATSGREETHGRAGLAHLRHPAQSVLMSRPLWLEELRKMNDPLELEMVKVHKPPQSMTTRIHFEEDSEAALAEAALVVDLAVTLAEAALMVGLAATQGEEVALQGKEKEDSTNPQG